jgi:hypothetical protein
MEYYKSILQNPLAKIPQPIDNIMTDVNEIFSLEDVMEAIEGINPNKAIGPDLFDARLFKNNHDLKQDVAQQIKEMLNSGNIPDYLLEGRLVLLSKDKTGIASPSETRPINILSHIRRILEKALLSKITSISPYLL